MSVSAMLEEFRTLFPAEAESADKEHDYLCGELDSDSEFVWFESLAKSINSQMNGQGPTEKTRDMFHFFDKKYAGSDEAVKNCIDTSFIENLFWQIPSESASSYWSILPPKLQDLYVNFHRSRPT